MRNKGLIWVIVILIIVAGLVVGRIVLNNRQNAGSIYNSGSTATTANPASPLPAPETTTPSTPTPTNTPGGKLSWLTYESAQDGYKISYPSDFSLKGDNIFLNDQNATGTEIDYPETYTTGTNLHEAYIGITKRAVESQFDCYAALSGGINGTPVTTTINGVDFYKIDESGAGAGNYYEDVRYATYKGNYCYNIALFMHSVQRLNYPPDIRPAEFDRNAVTNIFDQIAKTFSLL